MSALITRDGFLAAIPALFILIGSLPVSYLLPEPIGYILSGLFVITLVTMALDKRRFEIAQTPFLLLILYYFAIVCLFVLTQRVSLIPYVLLTPLTIISFVIVSPSLINEDRLSFASSLAKIGIVLGGVGTLLLIAHHIGFSTPGMTGRRVLGLENLRIASIHTNSNSAGIALGAAAIASLFVYLTVKQPIWAVATAFLATTVVLTNARMVIVALILSFACMLFPYVIQGADKTINPKYLVGVFSIGALAVLLLGGNQLFIDAIIRSLEFRLEEWGKAVLYIVESPLLGTDAEDIRVHNGYFSVLMRFGIVTGGIYLLILFSAVSLSLQRAISGEKWDRYVFASLFFSLLVLGTESATIGGLSVHPLMIAVFVGLSIQGHRIVPEGVSNSA